MVKVLTINIQANATQTTANALICGLAVKACLKRIKKCV
jgi:hypothetical protein